MGSEARRGEDRRLQTDMLRLSAARLLLSAGAASAFQLAATRARCANASPSLIAAVNSRSLRSTGVRASLEDQIKSTVSSSKVVVYSKSWCPFCEKTKSLFDSLGVEYEAIELDLLDDGAEI